MALIGQEHVFKIHFLTNEKVTSQHKDMTSQYKDLTSQHKDLTSQHTNLKSDNRSMPTYIHVCIVPSYNYNLRDC